MTPISARSRSPTSELVSMAARSARASSRSSTGVLPFLTTCLGPRTACAGLISITWPTTSQSKSIRSADRCCLTVGLASSCSSPSMYPATCTGFTWPRSCTPLPSHHLENRHAAL